ncbi:hypothetical protein WA588_001777, partial [Blastocystis sp. NMH]
MKSCTVHIKAGTTLQIPVIITEESTVLNWFYVPKSYDIDYRITKTNSDGEKDVIVPTVQSKADVSHQGKVLLVETGTYFLEWDNSTSWLREKCVTYHFSLKFPDLTQEKKIQCSKTVLRDLSRMQFQIGEYNQYLEEKTNELSEIHALLDQNATKRKQTESELESLNSKKESCDKQIEVCKQRIENERKHVQDVQSMLPFLIEDDRIMSMLNSADILTLAKVNSYLHDLAHQDSIWRRLFRIDSRKRLAVALQNNWLLQKWRLYNPNVPVPK